jgi:DNA-binding MarR family transcriptional regulator
VLNLIVAGNLNDSHIDSVTMKNGLSIQQFNALRIARVEHPRSATVNFIKSRMAYKNSDVSRIMSRLLTAGLVAVEANTSDKRLKSYIITQKGLDVLARIDRDEVEIFRAVKNLTTEETRELNLLFAKILDALTEG